MSIRSFKSLRVGSAFLVSGQAFQAVIGFAVNLVLVRYLTSEEFGRFALILATAGLAYAFFSLRIDAMIIRASDARLDNPTSEKYFSASIIETIFATCLVVLWLTSSMEFGFWELSLVAALGLRHWTQHNKAFFERSMPYRKLAVMETLAATTAHMVALFLVIAGAGWSALFVRELVLSLAGLIGLIVIGGLTMHRFRFPRAAEWRDLFVEARGMWLDSMLENGFQRLTILLVGMIGGERAAGFFFQAQRLAIVPHQFLTPIVNRVASNWFGRVENSAQRIRGRNRLLVFVGMPLFGLAVIYVAFADPIVPWLFGNAWHRSADLLAAMFGIVAFMSLFEIMKVYCWMTRQLKQLILGRVVQYAGCLLPLVFIAEGRFSGDMAISVGQSLAFAGSVSV